MPSTKKEAAVQQCWIIDVKKDGDGQVKRWGRLMADHKPWMSWNELCLGTH